MKKHILICLGAVTMAFTFATGGVAVAQVVQEKTTIITSDGTISEFGPERIIIRSETVPDPVTYTYTKTTSYVDELGNPVTIETVKSGLPVTVHYTKVGDRFVASKVVVRKVTKKTEIIK